MPIDAAIEAAVRRDRWVVDAALATVIGLSWGYLLAGAGMGTSALDVTRMSQPGMSEHMAEGLMTSPNWTLGYAVLMFFMWLTMMVAMMLPSAAPIVLLFAAVNRRQRETGRSYVATSVFALGYLAVWAAFSLCAVMLHWRFERTDLLPSTFVGADGIFGGVVLLVAGVYQLTPLKHACLSHCRSPLAFLGTHWRSGAVGALRMGMEHGTYCVGCCWFLMGLLFVGGVMNLYWIVGLAFFVFLEKFVPLGHWLGHATGVALFIWGLAMLSLAF